MPASIRMPQQCPCCRHVRPLHATFISHKGWVELCWPCGETPAQAAQAHTRLSVINGGKA